MKLFYEILNIFFSFRLMIDYYTCEKHLSRYDLGPMIYYGTVIYFFFQQYKKPLSVEIVCDYHGLIFFKGTIVGFRPYL